MCLAALSGFVQSIHHIVNDAMSSVTTLPECCRALSTIRRVDGFLAMCDANTRTQTRVAKQRVAIDAFKAGMAVHVADPTPNQLMS
jgi:hypothetical protein